MGPGAVRPLGTEPPQPGGGGLIAAAVAAVLVTTVGVLVLANRPPERGGGSVPTVADTPRADEDLDALLEEMAEEGEGTPTTIERPGISLGTFVPGFQGRVRGVVASRGSAPAVSWSWASGDTSPQMEEMAGPGRGHWDPAVERLAAVLRVGEARLSLYYGPLLDIREVFPEVVSFAWHPTDPGRLAFITTPASDGRVELWRSLKPTQTLGDRYFTSTRVARLPFDAELVAYGDWGYALADVAGDGSPLLITLDPEARLVAQAPLRFFDATEDGRLLVGSPPGDEPALVTVVGPDLAPGSPVPIPEPSAAMFSPNGQWVAASVELSGLSQLVLQHLQGSRMILVLENTEIEVADWSSDHRWVILTGRTADGRRDALLFVDLTDNSVAVIPVEPGLTGLQVEATGGGRPVSILGS